MKTVRFTSTKLKTIGKKGILKPDTDGYYSMVVGGLNAYNSAGEYYTLKGAEDLFQESSSLMRRLQKGLLKAELGHPKRLPGMGDDAFMERILSIEETKVCAHFKELWLDLDYGRKNPQFSNPGLVAIMAKLKPSGPFGEGLRQSLDNVDENVTFSIRGITENFYDKGQCYRVLTTIVTFDHVTEQGINIANKWDSPGLESISESIVNYKSLNKLAHSVDPVCLESTKELAQEALRAIDQSHVVKTSPIYNRW